MRHKLQFAIALLLLAAALVASQRNEVDAPVGMHSLLYLVADSQRDLTRMPSRFTRIPDAEEVRYGDMLAEDILLGRRLSEDDAAVEAYLKAVTARLARHAHRRIPIRVHLLPDRWLVNAFAIPGGHVFFGAGLLREMKTEDQLAAILAHEIEHIDHYHCAERLQVEAALRKLPLASIARIPVEVFQAGYSKEQELEADREGVLLAARAGYSAEGAVDVFTLFLNFDDELERRARTPQEELGQVTLSAVTGYFRSHPRTPDRVARVRSMIARQPELAAIRQRPIDRVVATLRNEESEPEASTAQVEEAPR